MSAILTSSTANEVEMIADGLTYTNDGTIIARTEKITVGTRLPWAMNVRGPAAVGDLLKMAARVVEPLGFVEMLKVISSTISDTPEFRELPIAEVVIAGVRDGQPQVWRGFTHDYAGLPAGQLQMLDDRYVGGAMGEPTPDQWEALGVVPDAPDGVLRTKAVEVMELLRSLPGPVYGVEDSPAVYGVGGHVQYVRIGADGVVTNEIVHQWPADVVGQRVAITSCDDRLCSPPPGHCAGLFLEGIMTDPDDETTLIIDPAGVADPDDPAIKTLDDGTIIVSDGDDE